MYRCAACDSPATPPCQCPLDKDNDRPAATSVNEPQKKWIGSGEDAMFV